MTKENNGTPEFLKDALKFGINLGLDRMNKLDEILGDPQKKFKVIHIAGTNGKGSTAAYTASILAASGKKVGVYTSPFLERFSERMRVIDGREGLDKLLTDEAYGEIDADTLSKYSEEVRIAAEKMTSEGYEHPTEFELVTAICYLWFAEKEIDIAVLETGLGGRLDSTNVIADPVCTIITAIGMDHTDRLGNTIAEITGEKAGILKSGSPAVVSSPDEMLISPEERKDVKRVIDERAAELGVDVTYVTAGDCDISFSEDGYMGFTYEGKRFRTRLLGKHQTRNAAAAIEACRIAGADEESIEYGITNAVWKGRAECLCLDPVVVLDGGHNKQCAESLTDVLREMLGGKLRGRRMRVVMGAMKDKDVDGMLETLKTGGVSFDEVFAVKVNNPRTMLPDELSEKLELVYNNKVKTVCYDDAVTAVLEAFRRSAEDGTPLLVTGSLYLIGEIRGALRAEIKRMK